MAQGTERRAQGTGHRAQSMEHGAWGMEHGKNVPISRPFLGTWHTAWSLN